MEATYPTKAIVLWREPRGEDDTRVTVYTIDRGKQEYIARGTRKIKSKLAGHLEPFCRSNIMVVSGKQYNYIGAALSERCFLNIKSDLARITAAGRGIGAFRMLVKENLAERSLFLLLSEFLEVMESHALSSGRAGILTDLFIFKQIILLGHGLEFYNCVNCREKIAPGRLTLDLKQGGLVCPRCLGDKKPAAWQLTISENAVKVLRLAKEKNLSFMAKMHFENKLTTEISRLIGRWLEYMA